MSGKRNSSKTALLLIAGIILAGAFLYIAGTFPKTASFTASIPFIHQKEKASVLFVGDIMLDRNVRNTIDKNGFDVFFKGVKDLVSSADISVANLEGPFTNYPSVTAGLVNKDLKFTFNPSLAPKLADLGFDVLGLANNHTLNFGEGGLVQTRQYIHNAGMLYYGEPDNNTEISVGTLKNGISIMFVGFHEFSYKNFDKVLAEIDRLRPEADVLVVSPHWGIEYQKEPTDFQKTWAHNFIDHGADAVIGAHPHVVESTEEYKGKRIFYSLGNFAFDQYFSEETMNGLAVRMNIEKDSQMPAGKGITLTYDLIPIKIGKGGPEISTTTRLIH